MSVRRSELLDEVTTLFLGEGFLSFGVGDLAARLHCSRSTLYAIAPSKEQIVTAAVRAFFRGATERVEARLGQAEEPAARLYAYLDGISDELAPASAAFFADLDAFEPARAVYLRNTEWAARRVRQLVAELEGRDGSVDPGFAGVVAAQVMVAIQRGEIEASSGLDDAAAYHQLAELLVGGVGVGAPTRARPSTVRPARSA